MVLALAFPLLAPARAAAQNPPAPALDTAYHPAAYQVFTGAGRPATLEDVVRAMAPVRVVYVGETHDDPTGHMLELELLTRAADAYGHAAPDAPGAGGLSAVARPLALSLEFFERDAQLPLDEYLSGLISEASFKAASRPWERYATDYRPLIELAKARHLPVIAANAPRRYVTLVTQRGREPLDSLTEAAKALLAPLPYGKASPEYRDKWIATISEVMEQEGKKCGVPVEQGAAAPMGSHGAMAHQLDGQVLWDATMGSSIARYLQAHPTGMVVHMVGGFHVERNTGIPEQLRSYVPGVRSLIVSLRPVDDVSKFQAAPSGQWGDFVIQTDKSHTLEAIDCRHFLAGRAAK